jgi:hypothetical protein
MLFMFFENYFLASLNLRAQDLLVRARGEDELDIS